MPYLVKSTKIPTFERDAVEREFVHHYQPFSEISEYVKLSVRIYFIQNYGDLTELLRLHKCNTQRRCNISWWMTVT
jgi:hypothetical protein